MRDLAITVIAFLLGLTIRLVFRPLQHGRRADEAETDRFLADLGVAYREELARKIADECDYQINEFEDRTELIDYRKLIYQVATKILSKE